MNRIDVNHVSKYFKIKQSSGVNFLKSRQTPENLPVCHCGRCSASGATTTLIIPPLTLPP